jgi:predicted secreted protein
MDRRRFRSGRAPGALLTPLLACLLACATPTAVLADDDADEAQQRVRFQVESARDVANDWIVAVVGVTAEDVDPAALADGINRSMSWALTQARQAQGVKSKSGGYNTHPVYEDGKLRRWRGSQELILESGDTDAMTALIGTLQSRLQLQSFRFGVSEETRAKVEEELVKEALAAFQERALLVRQSLGAGGYAIDDLSIDTGGYAPPRPMMESRMDMMVSKSAAPPAVEGGESRIAVTVSGAIKLE